MSIEARYTMSNKGECPKYELFKQKKTLSVHFGQRVSFFNVIFLFDTSSIDKD